MPQYAVAADTLTRPRRATRKRRVADVQPELPTAKVPDAVAVAPSPMYNVIPQDPSGAAPLAAASAPATPLINAPEAPTPTIAQPIEADDPATAGLKRAAATLQTARDAPVEKTSRLKAFLKMAAFALGQSKPGRDWVDVAMQAGQALGGGASGAVQPKLPGAVQKLYNVQKAEDELVTAEKYAQAASLTQRRSDQTRLAEDSLALRSQVADTNAKYKEYLMRDGKRRTDSLLERQRFLTEHAKDVFLDKQKQQAWVQSFGERKLAENVRQFNSKDEIARASLVVNQKRAASYQQSVQNGITGKAAELAADAAEGQALLDTADEFDSAIEGLDPTEDYDEILVLKRAKIAAVKQGRAKIAGAQAAGGVRGMTVTPDKTPTAPMKTKPKNDPLGLFSP